MSDSAEPEAFQFADGKSAEAMRTIGEVARALGIRQHVLRYWEQQFPMLAPVKRSGGRRYYRPEDIALIAQIDRLVHREGFTLRGARRAIETGEVHSVEPAAPVEKAETSRPASLAEGELAELVRIRDRLAQALEADAALEA